ncbi:cysteine-tryptophan domain-containing zinc finger protein 7-like [Rutidosis leptorrhynchoides]|uniref:cysteine-tryptophan domain-containing zinc finger protein 7-like n=1 Tax=Rutidosis leptorrhynchoides TaxID=125765 RepID=UPI003A99C016
MEDTELEEGEARFNDNDDNIDPDIALSYIDKRLDNVLGQFHKDFEGLISRESSGPRWGDYGSFLPMYKDPPTPHSHMKAPSFNKPCLNDSNRLLVASLNPVTPSGNVRPMTALNNRNVSGDQNALSASKDLKKSENITNPCEKRSLKVRIKVGFENLAKKKVEVCSSLGLISPSSSRSNNPDDSGGPPIESPSSLLRDMTSIFVPGNRLLSPLNENLLCLTETKTQTNGSIFVDDSISVSKREATQVAKKVMPFKKRETQKELVENKLFSPEFTCKEPDGSIEQKNIKKFSLDVNGNGRVKANTGPSICKSQPDAFKPETNHFKVKVPQRQSRLMGIQSGCKNEVDVSTNKTDRFEEKVGLKTTMREPLKVKVPQSIDKLPFERNSKLTCVSKENSRCSISRALKDKKGGQKDILKVRNSYKDILDTSVEDQVIQAKPLDVPTGNGTVKENYVNINGSSADVAVPQQTELGPADPSDNWVACDRCEKWRLLPIGIEPKSLPDKWVCSMLTWLPGMNVCDISQDETAKAVYEMNLYLMLQNQNSVSVNNVHSERMNSNVNLEITPNNRLKTSKVRPEGSSSSLMETSHSSMEYRPKRKCSSVSNEQLHEKKLVSMHANGGDVQPKRLKRKTESERDMSTLSDKNVEMNGKKRKLKDGWSESQPYANTTLESGEDRLGGNEKRLKTCCNTEEVKDNKVRTMKIRLSTSSKQNLAQDKNTEKVTCLNKDPESEKLVFAAAATSSCSKVVSGSCRRVSLQEEIKGGSPVGSVSSAAPIRRFNREKISPAGEPTVSRKAEVGGLVDSTRKEASKIRNNVMSNNEIVADTCSKMTRKVSENGVMIPHGSGNGSLSLFKDKDDRSRCQRTNIMASNLLLTDQEPFSNKIRKVEMDSSGGKKITRKRTSDISIGLEKKPTTSLTEHHPDSERKLNQKMCNSEITSLTVNKDMRKDLNEVEAKAETCSFRSVKITSLDGSGQNGSKIMKRPKDAANQNGKTLVTDPRKTNDDVGVKSFLKEYASGQTHALSAFNRANLSKEHAHRLKISGFESESTDAYFDSAMKLLYTASLLEENTTTSDLLTKPGGVDPVNVYSSSAKLSQLCAQEYEKRKEIAATALAYKCIEVACMKMVYCKSSVTKQDLQTNMHMTTLGESPSSSASDVDNLNNQAMDKTILSKSIVHPVNLAVARNQPSVTRLLDLTSDASIAMDASMKSRKAYKEVPVSVKRVVDFSFQNVKEFVSLVQNARDAINFQGSKGNSNMQ